MATESFYQDIVIDTPEAAARLEAIFEEDPVLTVDTSTNFVFADADTIKRFVEKQLGEQ